MSLCPPNFAIFAARLHGVTIYAVTARRTPNTPPPSMPSALLTARQCQLRHDTHPRRSAPDVLLLNDAFYLGLQTTDVVNDVFRTRRRRRRRSSSSTSPAQTDGVFLSEHATVDILCIREGGLHPGGIFLDGVIVVDEPLAGADARKGAVRGRAELVGVPDEIDVEGRDDLHVATGGLDEGEKVGVPAGGVVDDDRGVGAAVPGVASHFGREGVLAVHGGFEVKVDGGEVAGFGGDGECGGCDGGGAGGGECEGFHGLVPGGG